MTKKYVNGVLMDLTPAEEVEAEAYGIKTAAEVASFVEAREAQEANRASTKAKLEALGLSTDEVKDTFGL